MPRFRRPRASPISPFARRLQMTAPRLTPSLSPTPTPSPSPSPTPSPSPSPTPSPTPSPSPHQSPRSPAFGQPHQQTPFYLPQPPLWQSLIYTKDKVPAEPSTKWQDLDPDSQNFLFKIEEQILEHKDASLRLDHCSRLYEPSVSSYNVQLDASQVTQAFTYLLTDERKSGTLA